MQLIHPSPSPVSHASYAPQPRLVRAAHEFEAQMMKEILKPMTGDSAMIGGDDDSGTNSNAALGAFASEALGKALSQEGGFGIANRLIHDLSQSGTRRETGTVTGIQHNDTAMRTFKSLK